MNETAIVIFDTIELELAGWRHRPDNDIDEISSQFIKLVILVTIK